MSLSKKHFERMAKVFKNVKPSKYSTCLTCGAHSTSRAYEVWEYCVDEFILLCREENPRFDAARFYKACGAED